MGNIYKRLKFERWTLMNIKSALIRPLVLKDKTNLLILILTLAVGFLFSAIEIYQGLNIYNGFSIGLRKGVAFFLCWAISRELDPDGIRAAFYGLFPLFLLFFIQDSFMILPTVYLLFLLRVLSRSSGEKITLFDLLMIFLFSFYLYLFYSFIFPLFGAIFLFLDFRFKGAKSGATLILSVVLMLLSLLSFINIYTIVPVEVDFVSIVLVSFISTLFAFRLSFFKKILSTSDNNLYFLSPKRVKASGVVTLLFGLALAINFGFIRETSHLWFSMLGVSLPFLGEMKKKLENKDIKDTDMKDTSN